MARETEIFSFKTPALALALTATVFLAGCGGGGGGGGLSSFLGTAQRTASLLDAVNRNDAGEVRRWIARGASLSATDDDGDTPLHLAALQGFVQVAEILIDARANLEATEDNGFTPLHNGAYNGHVNVIRVLLDAGADRSAETNKGNTPQQLAVQRGHANAARFIENYTPRPNNRPNPRPNPTSQRGPGYTNSLGGALSALTALDSRARGQPRPTGALATCLAADRDRCRNLRQVVPNIGVANVGLRYPGGMGWVRPTQVNVRNLVGTFEASDGDRTFGGWGEWSYFYTTTGSEESRRGRSTPTARHGSFESRGGGCDSDPCHRRYVLAQSHGLLYDGIPDGTATYRGYSYASVIHASADPGSTYVLRSDATYLGDATLTANFDRRRLDARFHNFRAGGTVARELAGGVSFTGVSMDGDGEFRQDSGNRYINGAFYGPDETEAAGTWYVDRTSVSRQQCGVGGGGLCSQGSVVVGSFGARQQ